jgi:hypothetical protein
MGGIESVGPSIDQTSNKRKRENEDDDDDDDLYGNSEPEPRAAQTTVPMDDRPTFSEALGDSRHYCFFYKENGTLEVYKHAFGFFLIWLLKCLQILTLPNFEQVYLCQHFDFLYNIIYDDFNPAPAANQSEDPSSGAEINEILAINIGPDQSRSDLYVLVCLLSTVYIMNVSNVAIFRQGRNPAI